MRCRLSVASLLSCNVNGPPRTGAGTIQHNCLALLRSVAMLRSVMEHRLNVLFATEIVRLQYFSLIAPV